MATSTKIRPLSRLIDKATAPIWAIGPDGHLVFLSAAVGDWLTIEPETLVGRLCVAGASITDDPLDYLAASLAPPPGFAKSGLSSLLIQPTFPGSQSRRIAAMDTRFIRLGSDDQSMAIAIGGTFDDQRIDPVIDAAVHLRKQLDSWRRHHESMTMAVSLGVSRAAIRIQNQIQLAESVRNDVIILAPAGCFADSIATAVHQRSAPGEPIATIDGPLMDAELLDASMGAVINHLADSDRNFATVVIKDIDQTPLEAQQRLDEHLRQFGRRLRLIAIACRTPRTAGPTSERADQESAHFLVDAPPIGIDPTVADRLCGLTIRLCPLADRIVDLPLIATALLDRRRAAGDSRADRFSRAALDALVIYPWPDNLRELEQAIRHATRNCRGDVIGPEHLPLAIRSYRPNEAVPAAKQTIDLDEVVAGFEAELIRNALDACEGNRAEAARRLNISRARLLRKLDIVDGGSSE
ncbi:MAG: hypothetical protein KDB00_24340 [Planctomycetales bacterium]|nr:hypothetical protein [Planctomycetales bacterium]